MTAETDLLPLYAELQGHPKLEIVKHYARACVSSATAELHRQFGCELQDPNGTIWDHAAKLQAEAEALRAEVERLSALLGHTEHSLANIANAQYLRAERLAEALRIAEAALADIGDADREPGDDVAWCERRAALGLRVVRDTLRDAALNPTAAQENDDA